MGMELVRLFIIKDNTKTFIDIPAHSVGENTAQIELNGGTVYHAKSLAKPQRVRRAKLRKRLY